jgi:hypothetical protein
MTVQDTTDALMHNAHTDIVFVQEGSCTNSSISGVQMQTANMGFI